MKERERWKREKAVVQVEGMGWKTKFACKRRESVEK